MGPVPDSLSLLWVLPTSALLFLHNLWPTVQQSYHMREGNQRYFEWQPSSSSDTIKQTQINKTDRVARQRGFQNSYLTEVRETCSCQQRKPEGLVLNLHIHSRPLFSLRSDYSKGDVGEFPKPRVPLKHSRKCNFSKGRDLRCLHHCPIKNTSSSPFFLEDEQ